jgi:electron transfer flavoprotein beta subunit
LNIVVCVKQVPDTTAKKELTAEYLLNRGELEAVINPFDEYALEEGLRLKEAHGGEVTVVTMGPASAEDTMRKALAMGADRGVLVADDALRGTDWLGTSKVLAATIKRLSPDLILTGMESTDARSGLVPGGVSELLDLPLLTYAASVDVDDDSVTINRQISGGFQEVQAPLPSVVSVVKGANEPRYPSLKGIMAAKRKEIQKLSLGELGIDTEQVGLQGSRTPVTAAAPRPEKSGGQVIKPETPEEAARQIAEFLAANKFI